MNIRLTWLFIGSFTLACGDDSPGTSGDDTTSTGSTGDDTVTVTVSDDDTLTSDGSTTIVDSTGPQPESTGETSGDATQDSSGSTSESGDSTSGSSDEGSTSSTGTDGSSSSGASSSDSSTGSDALPDITGEHLLAVSIAISPDTPLQYLATIVQTPDGDGALLDLELQPLTLDQGSTTMPRLPFGAPIVIDDVAVAADGTFAISIPMLDVAGPTNPITGSDATAANVVLAGDIVADDLWCGDMTGDLTSPLMMDLVGSTFAGSAVLMGNLPNVFPWSC